MSNLHICNFNGLDWGNAISHTIIVNENLLISCKVNFLLMHKIGTLNEIKYCNTELFNLDLSTILKS